MVVGDDDVDAELAGALDGRGRGDAIVDRDDEVGPGSARRDDVDDLGREAVAVGDAVRDEERGADAEHREAADADRAGRGAVAVIVGDDRDAFAALAGERETLCGGAGALELGGRNHAQPLLLEVGGLGDAARGEGARDGRQEPRPDEALGGVGVVGAREDAGHREASSPEACAARGPGSTSHDSGGC